MGGGGCERVYGGVGMGQCGGREGILAGERKGCWGVEGEGGVGEVLCWILNGWDVEWSVGTGVWRLMSKIETGCGV